MADKNKRMSRNRLLRIFRGKNLIFDDEPLEVNPDSANSTATSASVVDRWIAGCERTEETADIICRLLINRPLAFSVEHDLLSLEPYLKGFLRMALDEGESSKKNLQNIRYQLARFAVARGDFATAMHEYTLLSEVDDARFGQMSLLTRELATYLKVAFKTAGKTEFVERLDKELKDDLDDHYANDGAFWAQRNKAHNLYCKRDYKGAEKIYNKLVEEKYELASTYCHLARLYLTTNRPKLATKSIESGLKETDCSSDYSMLRLLFMKLLMAFAEKENVQEIIDVFKKEVRLGRRCMHWTIDPLLEKYRDQMIEDEFSFLKALASYVSSGRGMEQLERSSFWKSSTSSSLGDLMVAIRGCGI